MAQTFKEFTFKLSGDSTDLSTKLDKVMQTFKQIGGTVDVLNSKMDKAGTGMESTLKVSLSQAKELKQIFSQLGYSGFLGSKLDRAIFLDSLQGIKDFKKDRLQIERQMLTEALELNKKYDADLKSLHKQQGESLLLQYNKAAADAKEAHRRRGEALAQQYAKDNEIIKAALKIQEEAHRRQGEVLMQQWKAQGEAHTRLGETLMRNYLKDSAAAKEEHRRRGEIIAQAYAQQNAVDRAAEQTRLSQFSTFLKDREVLLRADINTQRQVEISGMNSIEAYRARANQQRLAEEQRYRAQIRAIDANVRAGGSSALGQTQATAAMNAYLATLKLVDAQLAVHEKAVKHADTAHNSMWLRVAAVTAIYNIWTTAAHRTYQALMSVPHTGIQYEGTKASLLAITKSTAGVSSEMTFLRNEAHRTGLSLDGLRSSFRVFASSALTSGEDIKTVEGIFKNINTMATTLHMSVDDVNGVFLALSQIFNKGKLQAEELVKQLAQRIPGSVTMMAKAYAKAGENIQSATQRLLKDMKSGSVAAHENIAKFAEVLGTDFGGEAFKVASTGLNAELGKLSTSWTELTENIYKGSERSIGNLIGMGRGWVEFARDATADTYELNQNFTQLGNTVSQFGTLLKLFTVGALSAYVVGVLAAGRATTVFTVLIQRNPYILATTALIGLAAAMISYGEATRRAGEAEKERQRISQQLVESRKIVTPEQKVEEDRTKRLLTSESLSPAKFQYEKDWAKYEEIKKEIAKDEAELKTATEDTIRSAIKMRLEAKTLEAETDRVNFVNSQRKYFALYKIEEQALKDQEKLANTGITDETLVAGHLSKAHEMELAAINKEIAALERKRDTQIAYVNSRDSIIKKDTGVTPDPNKATAEILKINERTDAGIANLRQKSLDLTAKWTDEATTNAGKSITSIEKLIQIMRSMESKGKEDAVSPAGAVGRHQVMPSTLNSGDYGQRVQGIPQDRLNRAMEIETYLRPRWRRGITKIDPALRAEMAKFALDFQEEIAEYGIDLLKRHYANPKFKKDAAMALGAYNAGRGNAEKAVSHGERWRSFLPEETKGYVSEGIRLGASSATLTPLDTATGQYESVKDQIDRDSDKQAKSAIAQAELAASRRESLRLEKEKAAEQQVKNTLINEELQLTINTFTQNQLALDLAKITLDANKKEVELVKDKNFAGIELLKIQTTQARVQATLADAERKVARDSEFAGIRENELSLRKLSGMVTEKQYIDELQKIKESQLPGLEEQLKLTEKITKEEDRQLAVLRIKEQMRAIREPNKGGISQYLDQQSSTSDPLHTKDFEATKAGLTQSYQTNLAGITPVGQLDLNGNLQTHETYLQQKNQLESRYADANFINQTKYYEGVAGLGADTFKSITSHMIAMYGAQSKQARVAFIAYKAMMIAQTVIATARGVMEAISTSGNIYVGIALAAVTAAMGAVQVAKITAEPMPQAHGGLEYVPEDATYKLSKGERILAPRQNEAFMKLNQDLSAQMQRGNQGIGSPNSGTKPTIVKPQIKVVNVDYSSQELPSLLRSSTGEEIVVNHMVRNKESLA
jgi:tape measure domain-containing protein